jgi:hypothetical protein
MKSAAQFSLQQTADVYRPVETATDTRSITMPQDAQYSIGSGAS